jgi:hypothetical protein
MIETAVQSQCRWNDTGLDVEIGERIAIEAEGVWKDYRISCGPNGFVNTIMAPLNLTKRHRAARWFELVAVIGKFDGPYYRIGESATFECRTAGRLYLFANDAWYLYFNNSGSISARISVVK